MFSDSKLIFFTASNLFFFGFKSFFHFQIIFFGFRLLALILRRGRGFNSEGRGIMSDSLTKKAEDSSVMLPSGNGVTVRTMTECFLSTIYMCFLLNKLIPVTKFHLKNCFGQHMVPITL